VGTGANMMNALILKRAVAVACLVGAGSFVAPQPAAADTASTAAIVAGAAAIVGALLYDSSNKPYYVRSGHRYYVTQQEAQYYRAHHHMVQRQAWVPENEYPVARDPYHHH